MRHSKCAPSLPVTDHPSPRSLTCSPLTYQLSPRSGASGYQNRARKKHEYLITCPQHAILAGFLSDRLSTWGSTARPLPPPLLFTFHLSPALAQRGTLPNPSAHTLAIWQPATGTGQTPLLSAKPATAWHSGKLVSQPKRGAHYETASSPRTARPLSPYHFITLSPCACAQVLVNTATTRRCAKRREGGRKSGRWDSNPRRPAWEAGILPLNYARKTRHLDALHDITSAVALQF